LHRFGEFRLLVELHQNSVDEVKGHLKVHIVVENVEDLLLVPAEVFVVLLLELKSQKRETYAFVEGLQILGLVLHLEPVELVEVALRLLPHAPVFAGRVQGSQRYQLFVVVQVAFVVEEHLSVKSRQADQFLRSQALETSYTLRLFPNSKINLKKLAVSFFCISKSI